MAPYCPWGKALSSAWHSQPLQSLRQHCSLSPTLKIAQTPRAALHPPAAPLSAPSAGSPGPSPFLATSSWSFGPSASIPSRQPFLLPRVLTLAETSLGPQLHPAKGHPHETVPHPGVSSGHPPSQEMGSDRRVLQPLGTHLAHLSCRLTSGSPLQGRFDFYLPGPVPGNPSNCCDKPWAATAMPNTPTAQISSAFFVQRTESKTEAWRRNAPPPPPGVTDTSAGRHLLTSEQRSDAQVLSAGSGEVQSGGLTDAVHSRDLSAHLPPLSS